MTDNVTPRPDETAERDRAAQIAETDASIAEVREQLADAGPIDPEERAATLTSIEELEGIRDALVRRADAE